MWDKNKIKELHLSSPEESKFKCSEGLGFKELNCTSCESCTKKHADRHADVIIKAKDFRCYEFCTDIKKAVGTWNDDLDCLECKKIIIKYIETDFKTLFNEIKRED